MNEARENLKEALALILETRGGGDGAESPVEDVVVEPIRLAS